MTTRFFLDTRATESGLCPLKYSIAHKGRTTYITTDIRLLPENWNPKLQAVVGGSGKQAINTHLIELKLKYDRYIQQLTEEGKLKGLSVTEIRDTLTSTFLNTSAGSGEVLALGNKHYSKKSKSSQTSWSNCVNKLRIYDDHFDQRDFSMITKEYVKGFADYLLEHYIPNTAKEIFCRFRCVINLALDDELIIKDPARSIHLKRERTAKRNITVDNLVKLWCYVPKKKCERVTLDFFRLSFLLIGMNATDIMNINRVPTNNVTNGRVEYIRSKTKRFYSIKIEPEAKAIIDKHKGIETFLDFQERWEFYRVYNNSSRLHLKRICEHLDIPRVTMYYARHTWATLAHSIGISKDDISLALGHSFGVSVTDVYIDYNADRIDQANRKVIDYLNSLLAESK